MDPRRSGHFNRVARSMNNYVAASAHNYYWGHDAVSGGPYHRSAHFNGNYGYPSQHGSFSNGLQALIANIGHYLRQWIG
ncbi:unnamed protein product [Rotaria sp. Silwood1]|nr:unnamed protein product [Rotaria sp. Silwood1]CAF1553284.1 unnamed protein product [Rotaria sp. Silwood1]